MRFIKDTVPVQNVPDDGTGNAVQERVDGFIGDDALEEAVTEQGEAKTVMRNGRVGIGE